MNNIANTLSITRFLLIFPIIVLIEGGHNGYSLLLFILGSLSDYLDGFLARKTKTVSDIGALLDLLADKLFVVILLVYLCTNVENSYIVLPSIILISRELAIASIRQFLAEKRLKLFKVSIIGKFKTTLQLISIGGLIVYPLIPGMINIIYLLLWLAVMMSIISFLLYLKQARDLLLANKYNK